MITGFNTDIEHDGVVYHVQTEDKGLASPLILSLVYVGGAILASKRSPYSDLIIAGFDEERLSQRLKQQHRLICAAITAGRIEELKVMGAGKGSLEEIASSDRPAKAVGDRMIVESSSERPPVSDDPSATTPPPEEEASPKATQRSKAEESAYTVYDPRRKSPARVPAEADKALVLTILDEEDFRAGTTFDVRILLESRTGKKEKPLSGVILSLKILGTAFRPKIFSAKTGRDGVGAISGQIPRFDSGRAAIVIRAVVDDRTAELRRVIHPAV